jgi:hypothetical protein
MTNTMTEAEWLASKDPHAMGKAVQARKRASNRVLRLYIAAFWSRQSQRLQTPEGQDRLRRRAALVEEWAETGVEPREVRDDRVFVGFKTSAKAAFRATVRGPSQWKTTGAPAGEYAVWLLREVFGNPFAVRRRRKTDPRRWWMFDPSWRTDTAVSLAKQMYGSRDFGAMPILADALQDAGCDNDDILSHCREPGEHVRGCWVLDLVLGKG